MSAPESDLLDPDRLDELEKEPEDPGGDLEEIYRAADQLADEGGYVRVYRRTDSGKLSYCTRYSAGGFDLEDLRQEWGGGTYQLRFYDGERKYVVSRTAYIEGSPRHPKDPEEDRKKGPGAGELADKVTELGARLEDMRRDLQRNAGDFNAADASPVSMLVQMMEVMRAANEPLMRALLERAEENDGGESAVDRLIEGIQLGRELGGGGPDVAPWERAAQRFLPVLRDMAAGGGDGPSGPGPGAGGGAPNPSGPSSDMIPPYPWYPFLAPHLPGLVKLADAGKDPQLRAWVFLEDIPPQYHEAIYRQLSRPGFRDELYTIRGLPERRGWFDPFVSALLEELGETTADDVPDAPAAGSSLEVHDPVRGSGDVGDAREDDGGGQEGGGGP